MKEYRDYRNEEGKLHRVNGPAIEFSDGDYIWYNNVQRHRYYGVAGVWGDRYEYWIFGERIR